MKKSLYVILGLILLFGITGCKEKTTNEDVFNWNDYIADKKPFIVEENNSEYISAFIDRYATSTDYTLFYTILDLDDDNEDEMVIRMEGFNAMYLVLDKQDDEVYGYEVVYRGIGILKTDGTYTTSGGADVTAICKMSFNKTERDEKELASSDYGKYKIEGKEATKEEWNDYFSKFQSKEDATFIEYKNKEENNKKDEETDKIKVGKYTLEYGEYYIQLVDGTLDKTGSGTLIINEDGTCEYIEGMAYMGCDGYKVLNDKLCLEYSGRDYCFDVDANNKIGTNVGNTYVHEK